MAKAKVLKMNKTTPMQSGMLFHSLLHDGSRVYYGQTCFFLEGAVQLDGVKSAWQEMINRHEIFRTDFRWKETKNPIQIVLSEKSAEIYEYDLTGYNDMEQDRERARIKEEDMQKPFDFERGRLNRLSLLKLAEDRYYCIWNFHHILLDGWSVPIILGDFFQLYDCFVNGKPLPPKPHAQFSDYLEWLKKQDQEEANAFWRDYLSELAEPTVLPAHKKYLRDEPIRESAILTFAIDGDIAHSMQEFCRREQVTSNAVLQTAWGLLLQKYNNTDISCYGMTVSGRPAQIRGVEEIAGLFINTLPVVVKTVEGDTWRDLVKRVNAELVQMRDYEYVSLADVQKLSALKAGEEFFNTIAVFENFPVSTASATGQRGEQTIRFRMESSFELTNYDITVVFVGSEQIRGKMLYNPALFDAQEMEQIKEGYLAMVRGIVTTPEREIAHAAIVSEREKALLLGSFQATQAEFPQDKTVVELFEEQVERTPDQVAIVHGEQRWTYRELNASANAVARVLAERVACGEMPGIVGLLTNPSLEMFSGILGVLKSGQAYLPIDPAYPAQRIEYMLQDSGARILLTQSALVGQAAAFSGEILCLDTEFGDRSAELLLAEVGHKPQPTDLAYVIYTSGSTGEPKGVMIAHRSLVNLTTWHNRYYGVTAADKVTKYAGVGFDASVWEIFPYLVCGAEIHVIPEEIKLDVLKLNAYFNTRGITISFLPTQLCEQFMEMENHSLRVLLTGGDKLKHFTPASYQLYNNYGPTENTVVTTSHLVSEWSGNIAIGRPVDNTRVYILDRAMNLQPIGVPGELCIAGVGLAMGYLHRPELTAEKFVTNPFAPEEKLYRTGDLARWLPDGTLEFLGRIDTQVKIRGYRIELGEIESRLQNLAGVKAAVVVDRQDSNGQAFLCAYYVAEREAAPADLKMALGETMPDYMIPAVFVPMEALPLTPNGKIDRRALPEPDASLRVVAEYVAPRNPLEEQLTQIWTDILGVSRIGIDDNFFELGGHSLKATSLAARVGKDLGMELPLKEIFSTPTIRGLAAFLTGAEESALPPIEVAPEQEYYPVSSAQRRIFILEQFEGVGTSYNMPIVLRVEGEINQARLSEVYTRLLARHESLRTSFAFVDGEPVQKIHMTVEAEVEFLDAEGNEREALGQLIRPFDLKQAPLFRMGLVRLADDSHLLVFDIHHIVADGTSMGVLLNEFVSLYAGTDLRPLRIQYKDFAVWQHQMLQSERVQEQENYWLNEMAGELPVLNLPTDYPRPAVLRHDGEVLQFAIDPETTARLQALAKSQDATLYMLLLGIFSTTLSRYSGQEDLMIGTVLAGRTQTDVESLVGLFLNNVVFRCQPIKEKTYLEYLQDLKPRVIGAYEHQDYPIEELLAKLNLPFDLSRNALFDVMLILQNFEKKKADPQVGGLNLRPYSVDQTSAKYDMTLYASEMSQGIYFHLEYSTSLFTRATITRFAEHYVNIAREVSIRPETRLTELTMLSSAETAQILEQFNDTHSDYAQDRMVHQLFEAQVERSPEKIALIAGDVQLTYDELNRRANRLAHRLRQYGVGPEKVVALLIDRSAEMVVALLGVLKAGGAYLPIDTEYPAERIAYILEDSEASVLLTQAHERERVDFAGIVLDMSEFGLARETHGTVDQVGGKSAVDQIGVDSIKDAVDQIGADVIKETLHQISADATKNHASTTAAVDTIQHTEWIDHNPNTITQLNDLAYMIYTSGSTGKPKGVMVEIKNLLAYIHAFQREYGIVADDVVLQQASYAFDAFVEELYPALLHGGTVVIPQKYEIADPTRLREILVERNVTAMSCSPLLLNELNALPTVPSLRLLISGGDVLKGEYITNLVQTANVYNTYGPTEATVCATYYRCPEGVQGHVPIGKPIANDRVYILDSANHLQPIGVPGELCIAGDGVARGYLNRPELTEEKFLFDPFIPGAMMYRTGDLARWLPDGNIEFLGRIDAQVKIRGYRIELGEIEKQLLQHDAIEEAVVLAREDQFGDKYLCAYLVSTTELTVGALREYLGNQLPDYMIPAYFIQLERLPLTTNGKIDRRALPEPDGAMDLGTEYVAPTNPIEAKLAEIWSQVLGVARVGIFDHFFALGGHSLKATALAAQVKKALGIELPLREIFKTPTIRELAVYLQTADKTGYAAIQAIEPRECYAVSSAQKRMYILNQLNEHSTNYNLPHAMVIEGALDEERLQRALTGIVERHEALRTSFHLVDGEVVQKVHAAVDFAVQRRTGDQSQAAQYLQEFIQPFDLSQCPLFRVLLVEMGERYLLAFDLHHIIADGVSVDILFSEFFNMYEGNTLAPLRIQYKDFAAWQNELFTSERMLEQETYWLSTLDGELPVLNMPTDFHRPNVRSFEGQIHDFMVGESLTAQLNELANREGVTLYMVLLAAYTTLLAKYTGQEDIIVGSPIAGRPHADLANLIGMFVNTLALRNYPASGKTFVQYLREVKETALKAYEHQDYPFEMLVDKLNLNRDMSRNPLFDTVFTLQNINLAAKVEHTLTVRPFGFKEMNAKFDMTLFGFETSRGLRFSVEYCTALFTEETMERFGRHFIQLMAAIVEKPESSIAELEILTAEEKRQILIDFNDSTVAYPDEKVIHQFFEEQVEQIPDAVAAVFAERQLTYRELNERANQVAHILREKGVGRDRIVGIMVERGLEMLIGVIAVVKAGGAYLPIDTNYPLSRVRFMLQDSGAVALLTQESVVTAHLQLQDDVCGRGDGTAEQACKLYDFHGEIFDLTDPNLYKGMTENLISINRPEDLINIIYTSGSTGNPKGVMIEHRNVNRLLSDPAANAFGRGDRFMQTGSIAFDVSTFEIWCTLCHGATMYIVAREDLLSAERLARKLSEYQITDLWLTTALFSQLVEESPTFLTGVKRVYFGGEAVMPRHINLARRYHPELRLFNGYGPTESTTFTTYYIADGEYTDTVPIGRPIANTQIYILNPAGHLQPIGVPGELCIGGDGLGRGYLNRPDLTAEKFVSNPFASGRRMYKSGDLARWKSDGTLEFLGRMDHQVKIRGFRIELGEVEQALQKHPALKEVVVVDRPDPQGSKYLAAYFAADPAPSAAELREFLSRELPEYMIPAYFIAMAKLPLTTNGKVDRRALPAPDDSAMGQRALVAPATPTEERLARLWQEILGVKTVGVTENFFELGGHSLKATSLVSRIYKEFHVELVLKQIFQNPTIRGLARCLEEAKETLYAGIEAVPEQAYYPISSAQKRMFFLNQMEPDRTVYNMPGFLYLEGDIDCARLEATFQALVDRHEAFRTAFVMVENEPVQQIVPHLDFAVTYSEATEDVIADVMKVFVRPFDLSSAPLLRVELVKVQDRHLLMFDMHHIISDGVSLGIFMQELTALYAGAELAPLRVQYKDFADWQNRLFASQAMEQMESYWLERFQGEIPVLNLPTDRPHPAVVDFAGDTLDVLIDRDLTDQLHQLAQKEGATLYMVLLAAYNLLLAKYAGQEDIVVGSPIAGRPHPDLEMILGMFVNTLAMRNFPERTKAFTQFLAEVKENALLAFEHQAYPFEMLIDQLGLERSLSRNALFDTMFALQNLDYKGSTGKKQDQSAMQDYANTQTSDRVAKDVQASDRVADNVQASEQAQVTEHVQSSADRPISNALRLKPYPFTNQIAKFDLTMSVTETRSGLIASLEYKTQLFDRETIEQMARHFVNILQVITVRPEITLATVDMLSPEEREQVLVQFNDNAILYNTAQILHQLIEEQVAKTPDHIAVSYHGDEWTYRELNARANRWAHFLRQKGVKPNEIVGLLTEPCMEMTSGLLGILKSGAAYLPMVRKYPNDRIEFMLQDSGVRVLLMQRHLAKEFALKNYSGDIVYLEDMPWMDCAPTAAMDGQVGETGQVSITTPNPGTTQTCSYDVNPEVINVPSDLAYIIYTSGTTGTPKGVMIEHRNIVNSLNWRRTQLNYTPEDRALQLFSMAFDGYVTSFFTTLISGGRNILLSEDEVREPMTVRDVIRDEGITTFICVPSLYAVVLDMLTPEDTRSLRLISTGGEKIVSSLVELHHEKNSAALYVNEYGPTENAVVSTALIGLYPNQPITIGKPLPNTQVYILDAGHQPVPVGVAGEIYLAGAGLARGYLNRPELTAEKFIANPFQPGEKMYRSGDLGRWLPNGELEFIDRVDYQVKIRGFRIELGEIENKILNHHSVKEAVVIDLTDESDTKYLVAYYVAEPPITAAELKTYLANELPDYMIPAYFTQLPALPLSPNGKVDRKALPKPDRKNRRNSKLVAPRNPIESNLAVIWSDVLKIKQISIDDNFFELGGHSLKATAVVARVYKEMNMVLPLKEIFKTPTIRGLADYLRDTERQNFTSIAVTKESHYYPVSSAQRRMFVLNQLEGDSASYNMPEAFYIQGQLDVERFERAFQALIERHESLRTAFEVVDGRPMQRVYPSVDFAVQHMETESSQLDDLLLQFIRPFDLSKAPLLRVALVKITDTDQTMMIHDMHHIISDGTSRGIFLGEFTRLYHGEVLPPLRLQYKDFSVWQNDLFDSGKMDKEEEYWLQTFSGEIPVLNLPTDFPRPVVREFLGDNYEFILDKDLSDALRNLAMERGATLYMLLLAIYNLLLQRYTGQDDIIVGTPIAGRVHADLESLIGIFVNTLAMRNYPQADKTFIEFLDEVKENALRAYENQDYPFESLVEKLDLQRSLSRNPLFDAMFALQNTPPGMGRFGDIRLVSYIVKRTTAKFDLMIDAVEGKDGIFFDLEYSTEILRRETIERMIVHFTNIMREIVANPDVRIADIVMLSEEERNEVLYRFNDTALEYPRTRTVHQLFEEQVERTPEGTALVFEGQRLTYRELNRRANRLAWTLRAKGVGPDQVVGLMVDRSMEMVIGLLGVLKAGGAYLPIDSEYPVERVNYMLSDSRASILLTKSFLSERAVGFAGEIIFLDTLAGVSMSEPLNTDANSTINEQIISSPSIGARECAVSAERSGGADNERYDANPECITRPDNLVYIIYTSGSTGKPKGVMLEHRNLVNLLQFQAKKTNIDFTKVLQFTTISFDVSFQEIFSTLTAGGELYLISKELRDDFGRLFTFVEESKIHTVFLPVSFLKFIFNEEEYADTFPRCVRHVVTAGEQLIVTDRLRRYLTENGVYLHNHYGPSETHAATTWTMAPDEYIPELPTIGKTIANSRIYILNEQQQLQPVGLVGELCISGDNVGRGYLYRPELTAEKFVPDPIQPGAVMYKTGDLARWMSDGTLDFLGRRDHQVKIRGFRVEPGEVEQHLLNHPLVKEAAVIDRTDAKGVKYLCAYIVPVEERAGEPLEASIPPTQLRADLAKDLPDYMIPSYFVYLSKIPLNPNGKVDRPALPVPDGNITGSEYVAPTNAIEERLARLWSEVLGVARVGITDNFFTLGGHSLRATLLTSKVNKEFAVDLPLREIFRTPTVQELAQYIRQAEIRAFSAIEKAAPQEVYPLSSAQRRLFVVNELGGGNTSYNLPVVLTVEGSVNRERFEEILRKLVMRHEAFRTSFELVNGEPMQRIHTDVTVDVHYEAVYPDEVEDVVFQFIRPFDLRQAPLLRVALLETGVDRYVLIVDMHHIISDGVSMNLLTQEFMALVEGRELPDVRIQYKDFAVWQNRYLRSETMRGQEQYWLDQFAGTLPTLNLPTDYPRPATMGFRGELVEFSIGQDVAEQLQALAAESGATMYMVLLAAFNILLAKYSGDEDIIIGTPVAGRTHADTEQIVGMFVNTLVMRNYPEGEKTFSHFLAEVKETGLKAYENQDYQFEMLVDKLNLDRDMSRNPLFDVLFALQNTQTSRLAVQKLKIGNYPFDNKITKFDLSLMAMETSQGIYFGLTYRSDLFRAETMQQMGRHLQAILRQIVKNPEQPIHAINLLSPEERMEAVRSLQGAEVPFPATTVQCLFEAQVAKSPDAVALIFADGKDTGAVGMEQVGMQQGNAEGVGLAYAKHASDGARQMTYRELNAHANKLAWHLHEKGVGRNQIVGIMIDRSFEMMIAILGILKAGGAYMPIDPQYPADRIEYMLQDSGATILVTLPTYGEIHFTGEVVDITEVLKRNVSTTGVNDSLVSGCRVIENACIEADCACGTVEGACDTVGNGCNEEENVCNAVRYGCGAELSNPCNINTPADLAYVLYTSGSTGRPKGVMVEHRSMLNTIMHLQQRYPLDSSDTILQSTVYTFDASVRELIWWFLNGAACCLLPPEGEKDPNLIVETVAKYRATMFKFVPVLLNEVLSAALALGREKLASIRYTFVGGEALSGSLVNKFYDVFNAGQILCNVYGPTETAIHCMEHEVTDSIDTAWASIGRPISNVRVYLLDRWQNPVPQGVVGEIYISGINVARGYLNNVELTEQRFLPDPFMEGERMYRSGDLGRLHHDGTVEYLGRIDQQVKIRGYRVELGEIESCLRKHPAVKEAVVIAHEDDSATKFLCAYIVPKEGFSGETLPMTQFRSDLAYDLPEYMIPAHFMELAELPLTPNGKVDRKALPRPDGQHLGERTYRAPQDAIETRLTEIWQEILGLERVGTNDDFFELGGHSISAIKAAVKAVASGYKLTVKDFFTHRTVKALAQVVRGEFQVQQEENGLEIEMKIPQIDLTTLQVSPDSAIMRGVFLTGATGFLGAHILEELLVTTEAKIYCLVRSTHEEGAKERMRQTLQFYFNGRYSDLLDDRIIAINGQLSTSRFGLTEVNYAGLQANVDTVIHSAALVKHFGEYSRFERTNVIGTANVLAFAEASRARFFHVSTVSVSGGAVPGEGEVRFTENDFYIGQDYKENVYIRSKFEAENQIFKAMKRGVAATILRVGNLTGRHRDGHFQPNVGENAFHNQLRSFIELGAVPSQLCDEPMELTPIDLCARAIVAIARSKEAVQRVFHLYNPKYTRIGNLVEVFCHMGMEVQAVDGASFMKQMREAMQDEEKANIFSMILAYMQPKASAEPQAAVLRDAAITCEYLRQLGFDWPETDEAYLVKVVEYLRQVGYIG